MRPRFEVKNPFLDPVPSRLSLFSVTSGLLLLGSVRKKQNTL